MEFNDWFYHKIGGLQNEQNDNIKQLLSLARGPLNGVQQFSGYIINGFRFHTKQLEEKRVKQNSGVVVKGNFGDKRLGYFGVLTNILELQYLEGKRVILFKCDWWDVFNIGKGVKIDKHGFITVNTARKLTRDEPFVLSSQAEQVFYVKDGLQSNWLVVLKGHSDHFSNMSFNDESNGELFGIEEAFQQNASEIYDDYSVIIVDDENLTNWQRNDIEAINTNVLVADDIVEDLDSESETDDEDLLL
ncbi:uncharacterized protein LOC110607546 isoform X2 [Manihot esculenta]|nr:uncharacterized protein LOC110607546 isoform X2 [Manihot esculenta]XP_043808174.1 uncharacterized protein LOC110607546 isoform X2 [Manihot esculenta]